MELTLSATTFKAKCLDIFDRVAAGSLEQVVITKRGRVVAVLHPPAKPAEAEHLFGHMRGSVVVAPGVDLTAPLDLDPFDAESGVLHR